MVSLVIDLNGIKYIDHETRIFYSGKAVGKVISAAGLLVNSKTKFGSWILPLN